MKKLKMLVLVLFSTVTVVSAQQRERPEAYDLEKITFITKATSLQRTNIQKALEERNEGFAKAHAAEEKRAVNKAFRAEFVVIFNQNQQSSYYNLFVDLDRIKKKTANKYNKLLSNYNFPESYKKILEINIAKFEHDKELAAVKYRFDSAAKQQKWDELYLKFDAWRSTQKKAAERSEKLWLKQKMNYELQDNYKQPFIEYNFYAFLSQKSDIVKTRLKKLSEQEVMHLGIAKSIARQESKKITQSSGAIAKLNTVAQQYAENELYEYLLKLISERLNTFETTEIVKNNTYYKELAVAAGKKKQLQIKEEKAVAKEEAFKKSIIEKAIKAGLNQTDAEKLFARIKKREVDLKALKEIKKEEGELTNLFENSSLITKKQIKQDFAKDLANMVNKKQFSLIFGNTFSQVVEKKTEEEMESIKTTYPKLLEEQLAKINTEVKNYYYNRAITDAYHSYDKTIKKQKLSALRYHFEKEYKKIMESFGIEVNTEKKVNNRTFQW